MYCFSTPILTCQNDYPAGGKLLLLLFFLNIIIPTGASKSYFVLEKY